MSVVARVGIRAAVTMLLGLALALALQSHWYVPSTVGADEANAGAGEPGGGECVASGAEAGWFGPSCDPPLEPGAGAAGWGSQ